MAGFLNPQISAGNQTLTVGTMMQQPARITERISTLAADQIILDKIFHTTGQTVTGGAMLFNVVRIEEFFTENDVEQRAPGTEYPIVRAVDPQNQLAMVEDWGGKFEIDDLKLKRNAIEYMNDQTTQLANTIVEKLNKRALASLEEALAATGGANNVPGHDWSSAVTVGPEASLSEGADLPAADLAACQLVGETARLGVKFDTLLLHPNELAASKRALQPACLLWREVASHARQRRNYRLLCLPAHHAGVRLRGGARAGWSDRLRAPVGH
ncbi:hypothetical protein MycrhDRAFT_4250 [Mycolicibacterium rhodesiae JS60]|nr:hypothetical protein MycrhDRAFT_4250 [Mycolicibacterium rhodesiae JS60]